jgi:hypothetical protein
MFVERDTDCKKHENYEFEGSEHGMDNEQTHSQANDHF